MQVGYVQQQTARAMSKKSYHSPSDPKWSDQWSLVSNAWYGQQNIHDHKSHCLFETACMACLQSCKLDYTALLRLTLHACTHAWPHAAKPVVSVMSACLSSVHAHYFMSCRARHAPVPILYVSDLSIIIILCSYRKRCMFRYQLHISPDWITLLVIAGNVIKSRGVMGVDSSVRNTVR